LRTSNGPLHTEIQWLQVVLIFSLGRSNTPRDPNVILRLAAALAGSSLKRAKSSDNPSSVSGKMARPVDQELHFPLFERPVKPPQPMTHRRSPRFLLQTNCLPPIVTRKARGQVFILDIYCPISYKDPTHRQ